MDIISPKERLLRVLNKKQVDRPPVICPGGMMNCATVDVMKSSSKVFPSVHTDSNLMADLAKEVQYSTGFENFGLPFCMTIEAEALGSTINFGNLECEPKIQKENFSSVSTVVCKDIKELLKLGRIGTIIDASYHISRSNPDIPLIGSLTGPISTSASIVDPMIFLKELRRDKVHAHKCIDYVTNFLIEYAKLLIDNGASIISIADPTATGEILGPKMFQEYAVHYINKLVDAIHTLGTKVIVHICGKLDAVKKYIPYIHADAISTDAMVNLALLQKEFPTITSMGNLSNFHYNLVPKIKLHFRQKNYYTTKLTSSHLLADSVL